MLGSGWTSSQLDCRIVKPESTSKQVNTQDRIAMFVIFLRIWNVGPAAGALVIGSEEGPVNNLEDVMASALHILKQIFTLEL